MSLRRTIGGWCRGFEDNWKDLARIPAVLERARTTGARGTIGFWTTTAASLVVMAPRRAESELRPLGPVVDQAVREEDVDNVRKYERVTIVQLDPLELGNALECVGIALKPESWATMRAWLPRMEVRRDEERAAYWWTPAFAALALDEPLRYRKAAGLHGDPDNPFKPGARFQFNLQGFLRHLGGAIEAGASFEDVRPAWEDFLQNFGDLRSASSVDTGTLLWIARIVFHRIGGRPHGEVAQALHDYAWTLAGFTPGDLQAPVTNLLAIIEAEKAQRAAAAARKE